MNARRRIALVAFLGLLSAPLLAQPTPDRLRRDLQSFQQLPEERRQRLLELDRQLHAEDPATQARLLHVLRRYDEWLKRLPDEDRKQIDEAATPAERLASVKELRDREWMRHRPKAQRDEWAKLEGEGRDAYVRTLREAERRRRLEWQIAARFWKELEGKQPLPTRLADLDYRDKDRETSGIKVLVEDYLTPMLSQADKERLKQAEGRWPAYPATLVEIADRHPLALPGPRGVSHFQDLPTLLQNRFRSKKEKDASRSLKALEGRWPDFAVRITELAAKQNYTIPNELWAYNYQSLLTPMREFVDQQLRPVLTEQEQLDLLHATGQWPKYPQTIQRLALAHGLQPPWQTALPGPRERWDNYRLLKLGGLDELPDLSRPPGGADKAK